MSKKNVVHLHGYKEIVNFFREEIKDSEKLHKQANQLLQYPNEAMFCLPTEYRIDGVWVTVNRKAQYIVIYHN